MPEILWVKEFEATLGAKFQSKGTSLQRGTTINSSFTWLRLLSNYGWKGLRFRILLKTTLITGYTALQANHGAYPNPGIQVGPRSRILELLRRRLKQSLACLWCRLARLTSQHTRFSPACSHLYFILYSQCNRTQFYRLPTVYINLLNNMIYFLPKCFFSSKGLLLFMGKQKEGWHIVNTEKSTFAEHGMYYTFLF